ncbi:MAG TPA: nucleotide exchange factor GrpE [Spirochaetota bacterium]|nr:nucleotide exchange factor GrpE [Spirochaetota bacterium]HRS78043.1 nucleotide exchange factor GrpE [Spirochaetota bacterium]HRT76156.1 nucleotide exchange factor GrpE [Spirochaetota bacterium]
MDKHKEHHKSKEKEVHEVKKEYDSTDEDLEKKMQDEKAAEERRKAFRRDADRVADEERSNAIKENQKLVSEMENLKDVMLRRQADFENYKKRMAKQQGEARKMAIKDFSQDIMEINDDLLRAIDASQNMAATCSSEESHRSFVEGVSMISRRIEETMKKYGVVEIEALDREFDPNYHEAVEIEMSGDVSRDTVTKVYQKGFRIDDLVVRSAKVKVSKPQKQAPPAGSEDGGDGDDGNDGDDGDDTVH